MSAFDGVIGQDVAVAALQADLARTGGAGSTLIFGPEGTGRFLLAERAAQAIVGKGGARDLHMLQPEDGIDGVRAARAALSRKPSAAPRQVLLIRDADRLTTDALNALLKTLEEPPADAGIFMVAQGPEFLPETVVSRCRVVRARPLTDADCGRVLETLGLPPEAGVDAEGAPGRALFQHEARVGDAAAKLLGCLVARAEERLADIERILRKRSGEDRAVHRRRCREILRVAATRLRRDLPDSESGLRPVIEALRSLERNANASIVFTGLALLPWRKKRAARTP